MEDHTTKFNNIHTQLLLQMQIDSNIQEMKERLHSTQIELHETKTILLETQNELQATQTTVDATQKELNATKTTLLTTQNKLETTQTTVYATQKELHATKTILLKTEDKLESTQTTVDATRKELHATKTTLLKTQDKLQTTQTTVDATQKELHETKTTLLKTQDQLQTTKDIAQKELHENNITLLKTQNKLQKTQTTVDATQKELHATKTTLLTTQNELQKTQKELHEKTLKLEQTVKKLNHWEKDKTEKENQIIVLQKNQEKLIDIVIKTNYQTSEISAGCHFKVEEIDLFLKALKIPLPNRFKPIESIEINGRKLGFPKVNELVQNLNKSYNSYEGKFEMLLKKMKNGEIHHIDGKQLIFKLNLPKSHRSFRIDHYNNNAPFTTKHANSVVMKNDQLALFDNYANCGDYQIDLQIPDYDNGNSNCYIYPKNENEKKLLLENAAWNKNINVGVYKTSLNEVLFHITKNKHPWK